MAADPALISAAQQRVDAIYNQWQSGTLTYNKALQQINELTKEAVENDDLPLQAAIERSLGIIRGYRAQYKTALAHFRKAKSLYRQLGADDQVSVQDINLGETYRLQGNFTRARTQFHSAYQAAKAAGHKRLQAGALGNEAQVWVSLGSNQKAYTLLQEAIELSKTPYTADETPQTTENRLAHLCELYHVLVPLTLEEDKVDEAWADAKRAYEIAQEIGRPLRMGFACRAIADVLTVMGTSPDAEFESDPDFYYKLSVKAFRKIKSESEVGKTLYLQGISLQKRGKGRVAANLFQQAMVIFTKLGMNDDAAKAANAQHSMF